jgi:hypothetical protein
MICNRDIHLKCNPEYSQFIAKDPDGNIAVVIVNIDRARICDIKDQVRFWNSNHSNNDVEK